MFSLESAGHLYGPANVSVLATFVTAHQQDEQLSTSPHEVEPVSRSRVDAKLRDTSANRSGVTNQTNAQSINTNQNLRLRQTVSKTFEPLREVLCLSDLIHTNNLHHVNHGIQVTDNTEGERRGGRLGVHCMRQAGEPCCGAGDIPEA